MQNSKKALSCMLIASFVLLAPLIGQAEEQLLAPLQPQQPVPAAPQASEVNTSKVHLKAIPTKRAVERAAERLRAEEASMVVLYRTAWCGYCKRAAAYMQREKVPFVERDIEKSEEFQALYKRLGGKGSVPLIQFGDKTMMGFAQETFDQFYGEFEKSKASKVLP